MLFNTGGTWIMKKQIGLEYQQNNFSLQFCPDLKSSSLHHINSADINQKSADLKWFKLEDFNQDKTPDQSYFVGTLVRIFFLIFQHSIQKSTFTCQRENSINELTLLCNYKH